MYGPDFRARYVSPDGKRLLANITEAKSRKTTSRSKQATEKLDIEYPPRQEWGAQPRLQGRRPPEDLGAALRIVHSDSKDQRRGCREDSSDVMADRVASDLSAEQRDTRSQQHLCTARP